MTATLDTSRKPRLALIFGDPAGVGPELVAKQLARPETYEAADLVLISDEQELADAMTDAGVTFAYTTTDEPGLPRLIDNSAERPVPTFVRRESTKEGGDWVLANFRTAFALAKAGEVDGIVFAPLNKFSLHLAGMPGNDEMEWFQTVLDDGSSATELNILPELTTGRVTSHVSLAEVSDLITVERIVERGLLLNDVLIADGHAAPRIGVCALNPHAGENGKFGRHEIDIITPAVAALVERGVVATGPFPCDTIFIAAQRGEFDGILTMYHDQGQIAMKLIGFDRGVTMAGGLSVPVCTPAHGTAFGIVGQGKANTGAYERAFEVACRVAARNTQTR
ncbi:MAG TPA: 4-hydroxythreonine-4-phosphate dehydrogenase PdxA [Microlunatus sp.]